MTPPLYTKDPANLENIANHFILNLHNSDCFKSKVKDFATYMALEANSQGNFLLYSAALFCFIMLLMYHIISNIYIYNIP